MSNPVGTRSGETYHTPAVGEIVATRFRVDEQIGRGGMGTVFRATQLGLFRTVALKVVHPEYAASERFRARFSREARIMAALAHHNAVRVLDFGDDGGVLFIAMELLVGASLGTRIRERFDGAPLGVSAAARIGIGVAELLTAAHALRLVHRDLKPDNLFIVDNAQGGPDAPIEPDDVRVVDFGLAFIEDAGDLGRMTRENLVLGTPAYISPEQAAGRAVSPAADLYSLGVVLFELVTGRLPFTGEAGELIAKHLYAPPPTLTQLSGATVDPRLEELVAALLRKEPERRPDAQTVLNTLHVVVNDTALRETAKPRAERMVGIPPASLRAPAPHLSAIVTPNGRPNAPRAGAEAAEQSASIAPGGVLARCALPAEVHVALGAVGLRMVHALDDACALIVGEETTDIAAAVSDARFAGAAVLAYVSVADIALVANFIRQGVDDVVPRNGSPAEVARKIAAAVARRATRHGAT